MVVRMTTQPHQYLLRFSVSSCSQTNVFSPLMLTCFALLLILGVSGCATVGGQCEAFSPCWEQELRYDAKGGRHVR